MVGCGHGHDNNGQYHFMREKTQIRCGETYVKALEEERSKIMVFQRELPLCLQLVTQAIEACKKQQLSGTTAEHFHGESESCDQNISSKLGSPILEEFMPTNKSSSEDEEDHEDQFQFHQTENENSLQKSDWLKSVQLWNQTPDSPTNKDSTEKASAGEGKGDGSGAFKKEKKKSARSTPTATKSPSPLVPTPASSTEEETGVCSGGSKKEDKEGQRKMRRSWSPELHRRFLHALHQLGGSHVATPKQIREVMKVDGLTNDEVKSHLQKYRLHERSPTLSTQNDRHKQAHQFLVVGGIWVPPPEYTVSVVAATAPQGTPTCNDIHAPKAIQLHKQNKHQKQSRSNENMRHSEDRVHSNSPSNFSSITDHTTAVSLSF